MRHTRRSSTLLTLLLSWFACFQDRLKVSPVVVLGRQLEAGDIVDLELSTTCSNSQQVAVSELVEPAHYLGLYY